MSGENTVSSDEKALDVARCVTLATGCAGTRCQNLASDGYDTCFICRTKLDAERRVDLVTAERDRARSVAVALEQELARKDQALDEIRALHWKADGIGICELCGSWPCDTQRVLAALDAQLNKEDDSE